MNDMPDEPIAPRQQSRLRTKKPKKRRGTPRPNLAIINARRREEAAERRGALLPSADPFAPLGIVDFFDRFVTKNEAGQSFSLVGYQREILDRAFTFDAKGKLAYTSYVYSEPKKSGKTAVSAGVATWWAYTQEAPNQIFIVANDLDQAQSVTFQTICGLITRNPLLATRAKIFKSEIRLDNGTVIKAIAKYPNAELREHLVNAVVVESPRGWRLAKDKASKKIDAAVALAMALVALQERPESFKPITWSITRNTAGEILLDGQQVAEGRRGMSRGYSGPNAEYVHPHERAVDMTSEADRTMGSGKAQRWQEAWGGGDSGPGSARSGGYRLPSETRAALTPKAPAPPIESPPAQPPAGSADLQSTCQACSKTMFGTSLPELEAVEARHLIDSKPCKTWQVGRAHSEAFKRARRTAPKTNTKPDLT